MEQIFKVQLGDDIRRLRSPAKLETLFAALADAFHPMTGFSIYWQDEDGDFISVKTDGDLAEACRVGDGSTIRLLIKTTEPSPPVADTQGKPTPASATATATATAVETAVSVETAAEKGVAMAKTIFDPHWTTIAEAVDGTALAEVRQHIKSQVQQARGDLKSYLQKARAASKTAVEVAHASLQAFNETIEELRTKGQQLAEVRKQKMQAMKQACKANAKKAQAAKNAAAKQQAKKAAAKQQEKAALKEKKTAEKAALKEKKAAKKAAATAAASAEVQQQQQQKQQQQQQAEEAAATAGVAAAASIPAPTPPAEPLVVGPGRAGFDEETALMILAAMGPGAATQCPACTIIIEKIDGDHTMMCGCEGRPAGGTMEKALAGGGCGHEFNFDTGAPIGQGQPGAPANDRQWRFFVPELVAEEVVAAVPEQEVVTCTLNVEAVIKTTATTTATAAAAAPVHVIEVGNSDDANIKVVELPGTGYTVSPWPINAQDPEWSDQFDVVVEGNTLTVRRTDADCGWGQFLKLAATKEAEVAAATTTTTTTTTAAVAPPVAPVVAHEAHEAGATAAVVDTDGCAGAILRAWYGRPDMEHFNPGTGGVDLTEHAQGFLTADGMHFQMPASNKIGGDPAVGIRKVLAVEFRDPAGDVQLATAWEGAVVEVDVWTNRQMVFGQDELLATATAAAAADKEEEEEEVPAVQDAVAVAPSSDTCPFAAQLEVLVAMGFAGSCLAEMLVEHSGSIEHVIEALM